MNNDEKKMKMGFQNRMVLVHLLPPFLPSFPFPFPFPFPSPFPFPFLFLFPFLFSSSFSVTSSSFLSPLQSALFLLWLLLLLLSLLLLSVSFWLVSQFYPSLSWGCGESDDDWTQNDGVALRKRPIHTLGNWRSLWNIQKKIDEEGEGTSE